MNSNKKYWQSLEHLNNDPEFVAKAQNEFSEQLPVDEFLGKSNLSETSTSRRDFLKFLGFSVTAATLAACETPVVKSIPYVVKPEEITPGVANWYASTYSDCGDYCSILVKTREGRPIHIQGNKLSPVTNGGVNARVNASLLSLYDDKRLQGPMVAGAASDWATVDGEITSKMSEIAAKGGNIRFLTSSITSPSTKQTIADFETKYTGAVVKHVSYDAVSFSGMIAGNEKSFGKAVIPSYNFAKAKTIVSIGADFLANWLMSIEYASQYAKNRKPESEWMSKHFQFEAEMSLTGSNADVRGAVKPSEYGQVALALFNAVSKKSGASTVSASEIADDNNVMSKIDKAAEALWASKGASLVVCGSNDANIQTIVNAINTQLDSYSSTIDIDTPVYVRQGRDGEVEALVKEMAAGSVDALFMMGVNPAYSMPAAWNFAAALEKVGTKVSFASYADDTAKLCNYVCPDNHYLESWGDSNPKKGHYSLQQPVISKLFNTRQAQESIMVWAGLGSDYNAYIQKYWETNIYPSTGSSVSFIQFWNNALHDGVVNLTSPIATVIVAMAPTATNVTEETTEAPAPVANGSFVADLKEVSEAINSIKGEGTEVVFYTKVAVGEGQQLGNPWLQELADPITKVVWDNYITMNPAEMDGYNTNIQQERPATVAKVTVNGMSIELPVVPTPGQKVGTIGIALGYGQSHVTVEGTQIGKNVYPMLGYANGALVYSASGVTVENTNTTYAIAGSQTHHTMMGRKIINETTLDVFKSHDREHWNPVMKLSDAYGVKQEIAKLDLWEEHDIKKGHRWGMAIDLNTCIGCSACVTACNSENNIPVVGKDEIRRNRDMQWLRIDRYFASDADPAGFGHGGDKDYTAMEKPSTYPDVAFQPVMCQHCNHAPCETVCPVAATTHSNEGLNQMAYNRCVGTRYCANNCPYKVRRFNWFNYTNDSKFTEVNPSQDSLARMVLNPDVVVRTRGVIEKCSMCVQRIQEGKLTAKKAGKKVEDGSIQTACSSACPTNAIIFGDHNDDTTRVNSDAKLDRAYHLLEEVGVQPNIWYLTKVRNTDAAVAEHGTTEHNA